jgi:hypothetical protein
LPAQKGGPRENEIDLALVYREHMHAIRCMLLPEGCSCMATKIFLHTTVMAVSSCKIKGTVDILGTEWTNFEVLSSGLGISVLGY